MDNMANTEKTRTRRVEVTWVPVRDRRGRTHMEARWTTSRTSEHAAVA